MRKQKAQLDMLAKQSLAYGGDLLKRRKGRAGARPLATKSTMHLVLRSTKATGAWSFKRPQHERKIKLLIEKFSERYKVRVLRVANVGNHLHLQIRLTRRQAYKPFIRALTSSIAIAVTGIGRGRSIQTQYARMSLDSSTVRPLLRFWDCRPFTRIIVGFKALLSLQDYIEINRLEGFGYHRVEARYLVTQKTPWASFASG